MAALLSPLASKNPDGLDRVAEDHGFAGRGRALVSSPLPDYAVPGVAHESLSTALAGVLGTLLTLGAGWGLAAAVARRKGRP